MSIAPRPAKTLKVLADLENVPNMCFYRHAGPKGPKEPFFSKEVSPPRET